MGKPTANTNHVPRIDSQQEREDVVLDAEFEEVRETLSAERLAQIPAQNRRKGPVSVGRLCA